MAFSSYKFIFIFLPISFFIYWLLNFLKFKKISDLWLIFCSLYFYYINDKKFLPLFLLIILFNFVFGNLLLKNKNKLILNKVILFIGLLFNLLILIFYKYTNFFINLTNRFLNKNISFLDLVLPLGISFFTFRLLGYLIDCYKGKCEKYSLLEFILYSVYFPIILMGPITKHNKFILQLRNPKQKFFNLENIKKGVFIFTIGLSKKVLIATPLLNYTNIVFNLENYPTTISLWIGMFTNLFAFYFDFSGYSDMAVGISYLFNIEIENNFKSPYKSRNISDYWKRWHISLTKFLTEYIFNNIYKPGHNIYRFCFATMIVFLISGLWHGTGTNYILWGIIHGISSCVVAIGAINSKKRYIMPKFFARLITMTILLFSAALYVCSGIRNYISILKILFTFNENTFNNLGILIAENIYTIFILIISIIISFYTKNVTELSKKNINNNLLPIGIGIIFLLCMFFLGTTSDFLYQNF